MTSYFRRILPAISLIITPLLCSFTLDFDPMPPPATADFSPVIMTVPLFEPLQEATMTDPFGWRFHPISGQLDFHYGLDLAASEGASIYAVTAGTVTISDEDDSYGQYILLDHQNDFCSLYAHCSKLLVEEGDKVKRGQKIAEVGSTGEATGPHLHLEILYQNRRLDPLWVLGDGEVLTAIPQPEEKA